MIVIEMDDDNYILRVYDRGTGKDVDYAISYCVDDTEEPTYIIPTNKMHRCSTAWNVTDFSLKIKHKKGALDGVDWTQLAEKQAEEAQRSREYGYAHPTVDDYDESLDDPNYEGVEEP